jgi:hypothetical protein
MAAWLGAELRARRQERGLTLKALGSLIGFSPQPRRRRRRGSRQERANEHARCARSERLSATRSPTTPCLALYESIVREWPRDRARDDGLHRARLALACAAAGERDRATAEGRKALDIARTTKSSVAASELRRLDDVLSAS